MNNDTSWPFRNVRNDSWFPLVSSNISRIEPPRSWSRRLASLDERIAEFGRKFAVARHESILAAREIVLGRLREMRRFGLPLLTGRTLVRRQGRVAGESNYYRVMLC
jgi:hypothetical protein